MQGGCGEKDSLETLVQESAENLQLACDDGALLKGAFPCTRPGCQGAFTPYRVHPKCNLTVDICNSCGDVWYDTNELQYAHHMDEVLAAKEEIGKDFTWGQGLFVFLTSLPYEYNIKPRSTPFVVYGLLAANIVLFFLWSLSPSISDFNPMFTPAAPVTLHWFLTIFTSLFAHGDIVHLFGNMYFLYVFGDNIEDLLGHGKFLLFYLAAGVVATLCHGLVTTEPELPLLGASGAVSAVMAAYLVYCKSAKIVMPFLPILWLAKGLRKVSPIYCIGIYVLIDIAGVFLFPESPIAYLAHIGGFLFGLGFAWLTYGKVMDANPYLKFLNTEQRA